ncbi:MAG: hypothetical protein E6J90_31615 [Deltaproteobacteria bacterium]|nr:MAG: hypothetical protein E6J90_31615 [Deltaproteobacteria bacterium]
MHDRHDRHREPGRGPTVHEHGAMPATHAVGKRTLTEGLEAHGPEAATDPVSALIAKVKRAALAGHARHALELMATADPATQDQIAVAIGPEARHAFARNMPTDIGDSRPTRESSKILFDHTPDSERSTLELLFEARFRLKIGSHPVTQHPRKFDAEGLRRLWLDFQKLPADQVAHNWAVATLDRYQDHDDKDPTHGHGAFSYPQNGPGEIDLSYRDQIIENGGTTDHDRPGDPLHGVNRFDEVARHEIGHAVDRELGLPSFNHLAKTPEAGHQQNWFDPPGYRQAAEQMVTDSGGPIHRLPASERRHVIDAMVMSMEHSDTSYFRRAIDHAHEHGDVKNDPVYHAMIKSLAVDNPWLDTKAIAGRHYHQAYKGTLQLGAGAQWFSYREDAWKKHRVSEYQFRSTQEWFAEAYAAFYTPVPGKPKGALLEEKLPETHKWFVAHVDNKRAVAKESKAAHKKDKAPKKP